MRVSLLLLPSYLSSSSSTIGSVLNDMLLPLLLYHLSYLSSCSPNNCCDDLICYNDFDFWGSPFCHTRLHLGFSAKLRILQVPACKMEPRSGIIICLRPPTPPHPTAKLFLRIMCGVPTPLRTSGQISIS